MGRSDGTGSADAEGPSAGLRGFVGIFAALLLGAALAPIARPLEDDSFPFSTFPMFSRPLERVVSLTHAVGVDADGARHPLDPLVASENREVLQTQAILQQAVGSGRAADHCAAIARRVAADEELGAMPAVEIATDAYDVIAYFDEGRREPVRRIVHARCEVGR